VSPHADAEVGVPVATLWRSPDSPRAVDEPAVRDLPDVSAWADAMDAEVRLGLHGRTETQLLMGEPVRVLAEQDGWSQVIAPWQASSRDERGYPGWVRSAHLAEPVARVEGRTAYLTSGSAPCRVDGRDIDLSGGTGLWVGEVGDRTVSVLLPGGRRGELPRHVLRLSDKAAQPSTDVEPVLHAARGFLGLRYLWGGMSSSGLDCSGLVHLCWRAQGRLLPRDAHDQAEAVEPVPLDRVRPGDLYFFARPGESIYHVGFVTRPVGSDGTRWMLHAPEGGGIEDAPMAPRRLETLVSAGRVTGSSRARSEW
jgi:gamma-D-glutamyl-L-lysine dipeptidyl-peptidase